MRREGREAKIGIHEKGKKLKPNDRRFRNFHDLIGFLLPFCFPVKGPFLVCVWGGGVWKRQLSRPGLKMPDTHFPSLPCSSKSDNCCRKRDPFQSPRAGSCLTLGNELSEETHVLTKQKTLLGRGARGESSRVREPRRSALPRGSQPRVLC